LNIENLTLNNRFTKEEAKDILKKSVQIAKDAVNRSNKHSRYVAGSIGPFGACQCDGSEYSGSYCDQMTIEVYFIKTSRGEIFYNKFLFQGIN
jgi:S-methylmethionine-dependent homocysteine/selenocysteine methylase